MASLFRSLQASLATQKSRKYLCGVHLHVNRIKWVIKREETWKPRSRRQDTTDTDEREKKAVYNGGEGRDTHLKYPAPVLQFHRLLPKSQNKVGDVTERVRLDYAELPEW